jgi:diguanylate cyclase (GGDEF)-like protein/PAS domain S-box-containing protein
LSAERAADLVPVAMATVITGGTGALIVYAALLTIPGVGIRSVILGAVLALYFTGGVMTRRMSRSSDGMTRRAAKTYLTNMTLVFFFSSLCWSGFIVGPVAFLTWPQRVMMSAVNIFVLAMPMMVTPLSAALVILVPTSCAALLATALTPNNTPASLPGLFLFVTLAFFCTLYQNRRQQERILATLSLADGSAALQEKTELVSLLLNEFEENASDWLWEIDADLRYKNVSARAAAVAGKRPEEMNGQNPSIVFGKTVPKADDTDNLALTLVQAIAARQSFRDTVVPVMIKGEERFWSLSGRPVYDKAGKFAGYHGVGSDISDGRLHQRQIQFLVNHDSLTGLPNRAMFNSLLERGFAAGQPFGLLYLDLDHFRAVNETEGHEAADELLKRAAARLLAHASGEVMLARLAGDEFAIIHPGTDTDMLADFATSIAADLSQPYQIAAKTLTVGVSIGIVLAPRDGETAAELMKHAVLAVTRAKTEQRGGYKFYDAAMDDEQQKRRTMRADLGLALANGELRLDFQPVIDLGRNRLIGAEALLRWKHPKHGMMPPGDFIPLAEESGLIGPIGEWVLQEACRVAAGWPAEMSIAVNLSPVQFGQAGLAAKVTGALAEAGLAANRLELEITESAMLDHNSGIEGILKELHGQGIRIALDDFGTGYSSLSYLRRFPFNKIKIDRSFVKELSTDSDDSSIVLAIIGLAERLKMCVTAEGVETAAQAELLNGFGCPQAQGYLFSRPVPAEKMAAIIAAAQGGLLEGFGALMH